MRQHTDSMLCLHTHPMATPLSAHGLPHISLIDESCFSVTKLSPKVRNTMLGLGEVVKASLDIALPDGEAEQLDSHIEAGVIKLPQRHAIVVTKA